MIAITGPLSSRPHQGFRLGRAGVSTAGGHPPYRLAGIAGCCYWSRLSADTQHPEHGVLLAGMPVAGRLAILGNMVLRCLIVDDSPRFLDAARGLLEREGVAVVGVASNGAEALQRVADLRPDVTLVDIDLGGQSGFEVVRRLNREAKICAILISTHSEEDYADLIAASPALGFLPKTTLSASAIQDLLGHPCD